MLEAQRLIQMDCIGQLAVGRQLAYRSGEDRAIVSTFAAMARVSFRNARPTVA